MFKQNIRSFLEEFQVLACLRRAFNMALDGLAPEDFIEVYRQRTLRLSTHPDLVTYDQERLLRHDNEKIERLAFQVLPCSSTPSLALRSSWRQMALKWGLSDAQRRKLGRAKERESAMFDMRSCLNQEARCVCSHF